MQVLHARALALEENLKLQDKATLFDEVERLSALEKHLQDELTRLECELADAKRTSAHCLRCEASLSAAAALRSESYSLRKTCEALQRQVSNVEGDLARVKVEAEQALELERCQSLAATDACMANAAAVGWVWWECD